MVEWLAVGMLVLAFVCIPTLLIIALRRQRRRFPVGTSFPEAEGPPYPSGDREPRRPRPPAGVGAAALPLPEGMRNAG